MDLSLGRLAGAGLCVYPIPEPTGGGPAYILLALEDWREWPLLKQWQVMLTPGEARALAVKLNACAMSCVGPEDPDDDRPDDVPW